jgi:hypothetical protein
MPRPRGLEFGASSGSWVRGGCICVIVGLVFAVIGVAGVIHAWPEWSKLPISARGMAVVFGAFAVVGSWVVALGLADVIQCDDRKIILSDDALYTPRFFFGHSAISYDKIDQVRLNADDREIVITLVGRLLGGHIISTGDFASDEEVARFIEDLRRRVENAKRPPESPPTS